jgi:hypothetical protein
MLMLVGMPGLLQADMVSYTFVGYIDDGYRVGDFGTGTFSYDNAALVAGNEVLSPKDDGMAVTFSFDGQLFTQTNDIGFDEYPQLEFENFAPVYLDYILVNGENGVAFNDSNIDALITSNLVSSRAGYDFETTLTVAPVPIPGTVWLLASGILGLAGLRRRILC